MKKVITLLIVTILATAFVLGGCSEKQVEYTVEGDYQQSTYDDVEKLVDGKTIDLSTGNYDMY